MVHHGAGLRQITKDGEFVKKFIKDYQSVSLSARKRAMLDYSAKQAQLGKTVGDDFREGKVTLPVILAWRRGSEEERDFWRRTVERLDQTEDDIETAIGLMTKHRSLNDTVERARHYAAIAKDSLGIFPDGDMKAAMLEVVDFCVERAY